MKGWTEAPVDFFSHLKKICPLLKMKALRAVHLMEGSFGHTAELA